MEQMPGGRDRRIRWMRRPSRVVAVIVGGFVIAASGGVGGYAVARSLTPVETRTVYCSSPPVTGSAESSGQALATAARQAAPSVVTVTAETDDVLTTGSGIIIRSDGVILTNNHVIADVAVNGGAITVTFADGKSAPAGILGRSPGNDVAVIQAQGVNGLRPAILGSDSSLAVGDQVLVIGTALGEPGTVTAGIVSALGRSACASGETPSKSQQELYGTKPWLPSELTLTDLIQTDAPIDEGDSGGALVNASGEVIGMCTAFTGNGASSAGTGVGFAIRVDVAYTVARHLLGSP